MYVFVDTNILIYAHDLNQPGKASTAQEILRELWESDTGALSTQVLQEFYSVAIRKLRQPLKRREAREIMANYAEWCTVDTNSQLLISASALEERYRLSWWDALIIEAALRAGATKLMSEDLQHGQRFGDLVIENPFR